MTLTGVWQATCGVEKMGDGGERYQGKKKKGAEMGETMLVYPWGEGREKNFRYGKTKRR